MENSFNSRGTAIRGQSKALVKDFFNNHIDTQPSGTGLRQSQIFRECGFDWGDKPTSASSRQQSWIVALLMELQAEGIVERNKEKKWKKVGS